MAGYFELKKSGATGYMFNLKAGNHEVILTSEIYSSKESAKNGIASVQTNSPKDDRYERKTAKDGSAFFVLTATNGQTIGKSEMYTSDAAMENGIKFSRLTAGAMAGASPWHNEALDRTGAKVVAVERDGAVVMEFEHGFLVQPDDVVFICGSVNSLGRYQREFRASPAPARPTAART